MPAHLGHLLREVGRVLRGRGSRVRLPDVARRQGAWHHADLDWMAALAATVPGDFCEIGVFRGDAFQRIAALARAQGKLAHAFDSFEGMGEPGPMDGSLHWKGKFDVGGAAGFRRLMDAAKVPPEHYRLWPGWIPHCFAPFPAGTRFSWVIVDVDHYQPTADSLAWVAPRLNAGAVLALDDYIPESGAVATRAIEEFLERDRRFERIAEFNHQLVLRRVR